MENFEELKKRVKAYYDSIGEIHCPYFQGTVKLTSDGFSHLVAKGTQKKKERSQAEQSMRLRLVKWAVRILRVTTTVQEFEINHAFIESLHHNRVEHILKPVKYWGFIAIVEGMKIKVIVRQSGESDRVFWSVMPNWKTRKGH